jgi:hypothetical protein
VAFLDSDDWWEPEKLALQVAALTSRPECGWSYTSFCLRQRDGSSQLVALGERKPGTDPVESVIRGGAVLTTTLLVKRDVLERAGSFDPEVTVASDLDMWIRLAQISPAAPVPGMLATKRQHETNYTLGYAESAEVTERVSERLLSRVGRARHLRAILRARRAQWYIRAADRRRHERHYRRAWSALFSALPTGLRLWPWWRSAIKALLHPLRSVIGGR